MRVLRVVLLWVSLGATVAAASGEEPGRPNDAAVLLRYRPAEGAVLHYLSTGVSSTDLSQPYSVFGLFPWPRTTDYSFSVWYSTSLGTSRVTVSGPGKYRVSSSSDVTASGAGGALEGPMFPGATMPTHFERTEVWSELGECEPEPAKTEASRSRDEYGFSQADDYAYRLVAYLPYALPPQAVRVGDTWSLDRSVKVDKVAIEVKGKGVLTRFLDLPQGRAAEISSELEVHYRIPGKFRIGLFISGGPLARDITLTAKCRAKVRCADGVLVEGLLEWGSQQTSKSWVAGLNVDSYYASRTALIDASEAIPLATVPEDRRPRALLFSPDESLLIVGSTSKSLSVLDVKDGARVRALTPPAATEGKAKPARLLCLACDEGGDAYAAEYSDLAVFEWTAPGPRAFAVAQPDEVKCERQEKYAGHHYVDVQGGSVLSVVPGRGSDKILSVYTFFGLASDRLVKVGVREFAGDRAIRRELERRIPALGAASLRVLPSRDCFGWAVRDPVMGVDHDPGAFSLGSVWTSWPWPASLEPSKRKRPAPVMREPWASEQDLGGGIGCHSTGALAFNSTGDALAFGTPVGGIVIAGFTVERRGEGGKAELQKVVSRQEALTPAHLGPVTVVAWSKDDGLLMSCGFDGEVRLWRPDKLELVASFRASSRPIRCAALSPSGRWIAVGTDEGVACWDTAAPGGPVRVWKMELPE